MIGESVVRARRIILSNCSYFFESPLSMLHPSCIRDHPPIPDIQVIFKIIHLYIIYYNIYIVIYIYIHWSSTDHSSYIHWSSTSSTHLRPPKARAVRAWWWHAAPAETAPDAAASQAPQRRHLRPGRGRRGRPGTANGAQSARWDAQGSPLPPPGCGDFFKIWRNNEKYQKTHENFWIPVNLTPNPWKIGEVLRNLGILS